MEDLYQEHILDHYESPRFHGRLDHPDIIHAEHNPLCGDYIQIEAQLTTDHTGIARIAFGC